MPDRARPVVLVAHPSATLYGSDRMALEAVRGMADAGLEVTLALPAAGPLAALAGAAGVRVVRCPTPVLRKGALSPRGAARLLGSAVTGAVRALLLLRRVRPDVIYVSTLTIPLWVLLGRLLRIPVVCHVHEAESEAAGWLRRLLALPLLGARTVLANSRFAVDVLAESIPAIRTRAAVVPNGVTAPERVPPQRPAGRRPARLLYIGRLSERKGVAVALAAVELLATRGTEVRLDLVGDAFVDHAGFAELLHRQAAGEALRDRVAFHGFCSEVWPFLAGCDLLLVPSTLPEPFGNTAVEGVLAGRPVLASRIGGLPEAVDGYGCARLVPPGDAVALAAGIEQMLADYPALAAAAQRDAVLAAQRHAPQRYRSAVVDAVLAAAR